MAGGRNPLRQLALTRRHSDILRRSDACIILTLSSYYASTYLVVRSMFRWTMLILSVLARIYGYGSPRDGGAIRLDMFRDFDICQEQSDRRPSRAPYITPLATCYNPQTLFWNDTDDLWGDQDVRDVDAVDNDGIHHLHRQFFDSINGTCQQADGDALQIPWNECVGPFGSKYPWGRFTIVERTMSAA